MPIYEYQCPVGHVVAVCNSVEQRDYGPPCTDCGRPTKRILSLFNSPNIGANAFAARARAETRAIDKATRPIEGPTRADLPSRDAKKRAQLDTVTKDVSAIRESRRSKITVAG